VQKKTTGLFYNKSNLTTNVSENINSTNLMNTVDGAIRNNAAIGELVAIGSNLVVVKNIVNSGDIFTNNIYAKSIRINDAVIENTLLTNVFIDKVPISSKAISFISNLSSDDQLQLDTISEK
jgi:hypothetical protein